jgi:AraC-like DNA-binding protein
VRNAGQPAENDVLTLPLPIVTFILALFATALVWRLELGNRLAHRLLISAFVLMCLGTLLIALRFGYGIEQFILIQRIVPLFIAPLIAFGFAAFFWPADRVKRWVFIHWGFVCVFVVILQVFPKYLTAYDVTIGLTHLMAIAALVYMWRLGADRMGFAPLGLGNVLRRWIVLAAISLAVIMVFETSIAISFAMQRMDTALKLVSYGSVFLLISTLIAIVVFSNHKKDAGHTTQTPDTADTALEAKASALLNDTQLYLDTELTLERLARRLHVPARALSEAINQTQGMNVSQYVNGFRLTHAAEMLIATDQSVTRVLERSGFLTRSNFYREFERVYQQSPIAYRKQHSKGAHHETDQS